MWTLVFTAAALTGDSAVVQLQSRQLSRFAAVIAFQRPLPDKETLFYLYYSFLQRAALLKHYTIIQAKNNIWNAWIPFLLSTVYKILFRRSKSSTMENWFQSSQRNTWRSWLNYTIMKSKTRFKIVGIFQRCNKRQVQQLSMNLYIFISNQKC